MFRSTITDGKSLLDGISKDLGKLNKFQRNLSGKSKKLLKQRVGEVKKTLPHPSNELMNCMKKVGDQETCGTLLKKYEEFYSRMCSASPALCDDYHNAPVKVRTSNSSIESKARDSSILI